nr:MAG TPA: hypothetical protein [Caudoviricetes sp.]DAG43262.1 MAG TPA: hypothetical protein [Bacteriophage sp.]
MSELAPGWLSSSIRIKRQNSTIRPYVLTLKYNVI